MVDENVFRAKGISVDIKYAPNASKGEKEKLVDKALKKFKRKVKDSGIMLEIFARGEFRKPSAIKREDRIKSLMRARAITKINNK
jgi:ribosomal protein S21